MAPSRLYACCFTKSGQLEQFFANHRSHKASWCGGQRVWLTTQKGLSVRHLRARNVMVDTLCGPWVCARPLASRMALRGFHDLKISFAIQNFAFRSSNRSYGSTAANMRSWEDSNPQSTCEFRQESNALSIQPQDRSARWFEIRPAPTCCGAKRSIRSSLRRLSWIAHKARSARDGGTILFLGNASDPAMS